MKISKSKIEWRKEKDSLGWFTSKGDIYLLCPFHKERTPSCVIHQRTNKYYICYGCGRCGSIRDLNRKYNLPRNIIFTNNNPNWELDNPMFPCMVNLT